MHKTLYKLQYISQGNDVAHHLLAITEACKAGCRWIQLRLKTLSNEDYTKAAKTAMEICNTYDATLIINDNPSVALQSDAHGVHIGKTDMPIHEARKLLGSQKVIGGTANTLEDVLKLHEAGADYIGLGPFRFTTTKDNLSPILGLEGYQSILTQCRASGIDTPIFAIGGIQTTDVLPLAYTGIYGIAVSGLITQADDKKQVIRSIENSMNQVNYSELIDQWKN